MKKKKLVKEALQHPDQWSWAEMAFFEKWLRLRKERKDKKKSLRNVAETMIEE